MIKPVLNLVLSLGLAACAFADVSIELGKEFTIKKDETAMLAGGDIALKMLRAGRSQRSQGGDLIYCTITLKSGSERQEITLDVGEATTAGDKSVKLTKVDLTTSPKEKDPWATNSCSFIVSKKGE